VGLPADDAWADGIPGQAVASTDNDTTAASLYAAGGRLRVTALSRGHHRERGYPWCFGPLGGEGCIEDELKSAMVDVVLADAPG